MVRWFVDPSAERSTPTVRLRSLFPDATFSDAGDWEVSGCSADPDAVAPGQVFVATPGPEAGGSVAVALGRGAVGLIAERPAAPVGIPQAIVRDARAAHARLCHALAGDPTDRLDVIVVAGQAPVASTVPAMLRAIFDRAGRRYGSLTPSTWSDGLATLPAGAGSPGPEATAAALAAMARRGCAGAVVEVGPGETLDGAGAAGLVAIDVRWASEDDRDVVNARRRAYARLARRVRPGGFVVVDADCLDSEILGAVNLGADRISIAIDAPADLRAEIRSADADGSRFRIVGDGIDEEVTLLVGGIGAIRRALAVAAVALRRGVDAGSIVAGIEESSIPPEAAIDVREGQPFDVVVDPSRTPEDLAKALAGLRPGRAGRVLCVVGAEGRRDRARRRLVAEAAEAGADLVVFTSDNPRDEDPAAILDDLLAGARRPDRARVEPDRRRAIESALEAAAPGDAVLIAGKGRHAFQILADRVVPFDDRAVAARWLRASADAGAGEGRRNSA